MTDPYAHSIMVAALTKKHTAISKKRDALTVQLDEIEKALDSLGVYD